MDSTDGEEELLTAFKELRAVLQEESLNTLPLMILLHKQDLNAKSEQEASVLLCSNIRKFTPPTHT